MPHHSIADDVIAVPASVVSWEHPSIMCGSQSTGDFRLDRRSGKCRLIGLR
jgi:hypothetical protein